MALDLSNLTRYVDQVSSDLLHRSILEGRTAKHARIIPGVKYVHALNILDDNFVFVADTVTGAGFGSGQSATTLTQRNLQVCSLKTEKEYALNGDNSLSQYWLNFMFKPGAYQESLPWEEQFTNFITQELQQAVDGVIWLGGYVPAGANAHSADTSTTGVAGSSACFGMLNDLYNTATSATTVTVAYSGAPTQALIFNIINAMVAAVPQDLLGRKDLSIWCAPKYLLMYKNALRDNNNFNYFVQHSSTNATNGLDQVVPGYDNITLRGTPALGLGTNGYQGFVLIADEHFAIGTDLGSADLDKGELRMWYSQDFDSLRFRFRTRVGAKSTIPAQVVVY